MVGHGPATKDPSLAAGPGPRSEFRARAPRVSGPYPLAHSWITSSADAERAPRAVIWERVNATHRGGPGRDHGRVGDASIRSRDYRRSPRFFVRAART